MSWPSRAYLAVFGRQMTPFLRRLSSLTAVCIIGALANGCAAPPLSPLAGRDPSDPTTRTKAVDYRPTTAPYASQRPVEPKPWQEQSQQPAPPQRQ
jgi:hypothetical protein